MAAAPKDKYVWGFPIRAAKAHVFYNYTSLCGRWMFTGHESVIMGVPEKQGPDDCAVCYRKLRAIKNVGGGG